MDVDLAIFDKINNMTHVEMCRVWRFGAGDLPYFRTPYYDAFKKRFDEFGGFTPQISKLIGW